MPSLFFFFLPLPRFFLSPPLAWFHVSYLWTISFCWFFFWHFYYFLRFSLSSLPQVAALQEEKSSLLAENQVLMERLNQSDSIEDINSPAGRRHLQLQTQLEQLQEETFRCGAAKGERFCHIKSECWIDWLSSVENTLLVPQVDDSRQARMQTQTRNFQFWKMIIVTNSF